MADMLPVGTFIPRQPTSLALRKTEGTYNFTGLFHLNSEQIRGRIYRMNRDHKKEILQFTPPLTI